MLRRRTAPPPLEIQGAERERALKSRREGKMHTTITRAQNAFGFFTTVAFVVALFVAGSDYLVARTPGAEVKVGSGGVTV